MPHSLRSEVRAIRAELGAISSVRGVCLPCGQRKKRMQELFATSAAGTQGPRGDVSFGSKCARSRTGLRGRRVDNDRRPSVPPSPCRQGSGGMLSRTKKHSLGQANPPGSLMNTRTSGLASSSEARTGERAAITKRHSRSDRISPEPQEQQQKRVC